MRTVAFALALVSLTACPQKSGDSPGPAASSAAPAAIASAPAVAVTPATATTGGAATPSAVASAKPASSGTPGKYPQASTRLLNDMELTMEGDAKSCEELNIMKNEIYARHGYKFKNKKLADYFAQQPWYEAKSDNVETMLTGTEHKNVELIVNVQKAHGCPP